jgi:hypothetical protein
MSLQFEVYDSAVPCNLSTAEVFFICSPYEGLQERRGQGRTLCQVICEITLLHSKKLNYTVRPAGFDVPNDTNKVAVLKLDKSGPRKCRSHKNKINPLSVSMSFNTNENSTFFRHIETTLKYHWVICLFSGISTHL